MSENSNKKKEREESASQIMIKKLKKGLGKKECHEKIKKKFSEIFEIMGLSAISSKKLCGDIFWMINSCCSHEELEEKVYLRLMEERISGKNMKQILQEGIANRQNIVFEDIKSYCKGLSGKMLDYGCGNGKIAQLLYFKLGVNIEGVDVVNYLDESVDFPFFLLGEKVYKENEFGSIYVGNVLHHEKDNGVILDFLSRVGNDLMLVTETVPFTPSEEKKGLTIEQIENAMLVTFASDRLYNRPFNYGANIPVPGTYETIAGRKKRFQMSGRTVEETKFLGVRHKLIREHHCLFVLRRK